MAITINGSGTIGGVSVGGLPDGIVDTDMLASGAVGQSKIATGAVGQSQIANGAVGESQFVSSSIPVGVGQSWQNVTSSRALNTTYTNTTGRPIMVAVAVYQSSAGIGINMQLNGVGFNAHQDNSSSGGGCFSFIVLNNDTYYIPSETGKSINRWLELR